MKMKTLGWLVVAGALASSFVSCSQPKVECVAAHAGAFFGFAAVYTPPANPPACAPADSLPPGDIIGFETYHPSADNGDGPAADYTSTLVAVQADTLGFIAKSKRKAGLGDPKDPLTPGVDTKTVTFKDGHNAYAFGNFDSTEPDGSDFCKLTTVTPALQEYPGAPAMPPDVPDPTDPLTIKYAWKNLEIYVTATSQGTQFQGDLTYTENDCSVDYHVLGVWPGVDCYAYDADGNNILDPVTMEPTFNDAACCPDADPNGGRPTGSGINPDFPVVCDHRLALCVLDTKVSDKIPVLKTDWSKDVKMCQLTPASGGMGGGTP